MLICIMMTCALVLSRSKAEQWTKKKTIGEGASGKAVLPSPPPPSFSVSTSFQLLPSCNSQKKKKTPENR